MFLHPSGSKDAPNSRVQTVCHFCETPRVWRPKKTLRFVFLAQCRDHGEPQDSNHPHADLQVSSACWCWLVELCEKWLTPSLISGRRSPGNEAISREDGRALRTLGGLRLGERGPTAFLSRASERSGEGADRAAVGACVLGETLTQLPVCSRR